MLKYLSIIFSALFISACVKDKPETKLQSPVNLSLEKKVYVVNEGQFPAGAGDVSLYDPATDNVIESFYQLQNNQQLGNVAQSLNYLNGSFYIVVNNSNKIVVCDKQFKKSGQINGLVSPRYILPITNQKAYVSDLYANAISIIDLNSNSKTGTIPCFGKTEKMALLYNKVFVTNTDREYVYIVNTLNDLIMDSVKVGINASSLVIDKTDRIWVLSSGNSSTTVGSLTKINPLTNQVELSIPFTAYTLPAHLNLNKTKDTLFFLNNGIYRMPVSENNLPSLPFVASTNKNFYGLGINPNDYSIYAADALDYSQRSQIYIYNANGTLKSSFKAGVISNSFYFE